MTATSARERILEAMYATAARYGIAKTTVEDVARQARLSRATVYRYFPGGKEQLVRETIAWESARFFSRLAAVVEDAADLASMLEEALLFAHRAVEEHAVLQKILVTEPELLLPQLTVQSTRLVAVIAAFLRPALEREGAEGRLVPGLDVARAAEHIARLFLSFIGTQAQWDLTDRTAVRQLVHTELLSGVTA